MLGHPAQLAAQLRGIDCVPAVMAGAVANPVERILGLTHRAQDVAHHGNVVALSIRANKVGLPHPSVCKDGPHGT